LKIIKLKITPDQMKGKRELTVGGYLLITGGFWGLIGKGERHLLNPDTKYTLNGINSYILLRIEKSGWWMIRNVLILEITGVAGSQLPRTLVRG
jgi:hypothetical protein